MMPLQKQRFVSRDIQLQSDSDSQQDQQQAQQHQIIIGNAPKNQHRLGLCNRLMLIILVCLLVTAILYLIYISAIKISIDFGLGNAQQLDAKQIKDNQNQQKPQTSFPQMNKPSNLQHMQQSNSPQNRSKAPQQKLQLPSLSIRKQNSQIKCIPDKTIDGADELQENGYYVQQTAYLEIKVIAQKGPPAQNIYQWEGVRQFIANITNMTNDSVIAFDHPSTTLLMISDKYSNNRLFVSDRTNRPLLQKNLIINDLLPSVTFVPYRSLLQANNYHILITDSLQSLEQTLIKKHKNVMVLVQLVQPQLLDSMVLRNLKVYTFSSEQQCNTRTISRYQSAGWRIDQKSWLLPGWLVFLNKQQNLPQVHIHKNYQQSKLHKQTNRCDQLIEFKQEQYQLQNQQVLSRFPCSLLVLKKGDLLVDYKQLSHLISFLRTAVVNRPVLFDSGSFLYALLIASLLPQNVSLMVLQQYAQYKQLRKNLVLNDLQDVVVFYSKQVDYDIVFIKDDKLQAQSPQKTVFLFNNPDYYISTILIEKVISK